MQEYIGLIVAVAVVLVVIALQVFSFLKTKKNITLVQRSRQPFIERNICDF